MATGAIMVCIDILRRVGLSPSCLNPFDAGEGYSEASYYKEDGFCLLSGVVTLPPDQRHSSHVVDNTISTLPAECRPTRRNLFFSVNAFGAAALLSVRSLLAVTGSLAADASVLTR